MSVVCCTRLGQNLIDYDCNHADFLTFSPFLTISLNRAGQYFCHPVFSVLCHVFSQLVFLHVSLQVFPPSLSRSVSLPPPRHLQSQRFCTDVARSLEQWSNHFSLLFSRKVSRGFTWASFLMSSFRMWSNLVFHLAHLNSLTSAEFSVLDYYPVVDIGL